MTTLHPSSRCAISPSALFMLLDSCRNDHVRILSSCYFFSHQQHSKVRPSSYWGVSRTHDPSVALNKQPLISNGFGSLSTRSLRVRFTNNPFPRHVQGRFMTAGRFDERSSCCIIVLLRKCLGARARDTSVTSVPTAKIVRLRT